MDTTIILTQIIGLYFLVMGVGVFLNPERIRGAIKEAGSSYLFPFFDGAIALVVGLLIVLLHNMWTTLPEIIVSATGWLAVAEGVLMSLLPQRSIQQIVKVFGSSQWATTMGVVLVAIGAYMTYVGFFA